MTLAPERPVATVTPTPTARKRSLWQRINDIPGAIVFIATLAIAFSIWWAVSAAAIWSPIFVPSPALVWEKFLAATGTHDGTVGYAGVTVWEHLWVSVRRILVSSAIAVVIGVPFGFAIGLVPLLRKAFGPFITFLRQLPPLAYFSLLIIWFGIDDSPKTILLVIAAMPPVIVATAAGLDDISGDYINAAKSLGANTWSLMRRILLPASLPAIFTGIRLGVGAAYSSVVASETVNGLPGIGGVIRDAQRYNQTATVILGILLLGLSGLVIELIITKVGARLTPWQGKA